MNLNKILCKYCSENNDHKNVTVGSVIDFMLGIIGRLGVAIMLLFLAFMVTILFLSPIVNPSTLKEAITDVLISWGILIVILALIFGVWKLYDKSHEIEIARCERQE